MSGREWEAVARREPYWGVLSHDRFRSSRLDDRSLEEFWASGEQHVAAVFNVLRARLSMDTHPAVAVDFGCGVGRLLPALGDRAARVVGMDASPTMLALARANLDSWQVDGCTLVRSLADLRAVAPTYDFLHSALVFQHIRPAEGYSTFRELLAGLSSGGCGAVQFRLRRPYAAARALAALRARSRAAGRLAALLRAAPREAALIEMHGYDLNRLLRILYRAGVDEVVASVAGAGGLDVTLLFRKP